jgi:hypothetical protein
LFSSSQNIPDNLPLQIIYFREIYEKSFASPMMGYQILSALCIPSF